MPTINGQHVEFEGGATAPLYQFVREEQINVIDTLYSAAPISDAQYLNLLRLHVQNSTPILNLRQTLEETLNDTSGIAQAFLDHPFAETNT